MVLRQPKALPVIDEHLDRRRPPATEHKHTAGKRIRLQLLLAQPCQRIDPLPEVDRLDGNQDAHLGGNLNHPPRPQTTRLNATRSGGNAPRSTTRTRPPCGPSSSTVHSSQPSAGRVAGTSTNVGDAGAHGTPPDVSATVFSLCESRCSARAVRAQEQVLVEVGEEWRYFKGTQAPPANWASPGFNDADAPWLSGVTGIGFPFTQSGRVEKRPAGATPSSLRSCTRQSLSCRPPRASGGWEWSRAVRPPSWPPESAAHARKSVSPGSR